MSLLLDFGLLDDLNIAVVNGHSVDLKGQTLKTNGLGPLVELALLRNSGVRALPDFAAVEPTDISSLVACDFRGHRSDASIGDRLGSHFIVNRFSSESEDRWTAFLYWAQRAAERAGLQKRIAQQLVGAVGELEDNIRLHSQAIETGYVAYRAGQGEFEFVVADAGVGVLRSMQGCDDYKALTDSGEALRVALQDGESRFGRASQRGCGFRPLFLGLANLMGLLRFRSGDHVLVIDGRSPQIAMARIHQRPYLPGFVASIICKNPA